MAQLDPSIILAGVPDYNKIREGNQNIKNAVMQNEIDRYKLDEAKAAGARTSKLREIFATTDDGNLDQALKQGGYIEERNAMQDRRAKMQGDGLKNKELEFKNAKTKIELTGQAMGALLKDPSDQNLQFTLKSLVDNGVMSPEEAQAAYDKGPKDPEGIRALAQKHYVSALDTKEQLEKFTTSNTGNAQVTQGVDPVTGKSRIVNALEIQRSPDNIANDSRMREEGDLNRANQLKVAGMKQDNSAPVSVMGPDGKPVYVNRTQAMGMQPYSAAQDQKEVAKMQQKDQASISSQQALDQLAVLFQHPGRAAGTGGSSFMSAIPGTNAKGFQSQLDTFKAQAFIPMVSALKGMGALSDAEGKKLADAIGALNPEMPEKEFEASLKAVAKSLYEKAQASGLNVSLPDFAADVAKTSTKKPAGYPAAKQAPDGNWYIKKGNKFFKVVDNG
jgi:hypothetical protein